MKANNPKLQPILTDRVTKDDFLRWLKSQEVLKTQSAKLVPSTALTDKSKSDRKGV